MSPTIVTTETIGGKEMTLYIEKSKCRIKDSLNCQFLEIETDEPIEFTGGDGNDYILFDEDDEGIGPAPWKPFVANNPKYKLKSNEQV